MLTSIRLFILKRLTRPHVFVCGRGAIKRECTFYGMPIIKHARVVWVPASKAYRNRVSAGCLYVFPPHLLAHFSFQCSVLFLTFLMIQRNQKSCPCSLRQRFDPPAASRCHQTRFCIPVRYSIPPRWGSESSLGERKRGGHALWGGFLLGPTFLSL